MLINMLYKKNIKIFGIKYFLSNCLYFLSEIKYLFNYLTNGEEHVVEEDSCLQTLL